MYFSKIVATGACLPEQIITNDRLAEIVDTNDEWIVSRSGIARRRFSDGQNTSEIAAGAAKKIIERAGIQAEDVELIIVATVSPDYCTPSTACIVQDIIGAKNAVAFDIGAACSGFIFGMSTADKFIRSGMYKNAIVIGAEVLSKHLDFNDRSTCVLFGDGAAGVYLERSDEPFILAENMGSDGSQNQALTAKYYPVVSAYCKTDTKRAEHVEMDGKSIFDFATRKVPKSVIKLLEDAGENPDSIDWVIPHQANKRIIEIVSRKVKIPLEKFYINMADYGNTSSASIPIALNEAVEKGLIKKGHKVVLCGFGAGLTWGSALIHFK